MNEKAAEAQEITKQEKKTPKPNWSTPQQETNQPRRPRGGKAQHVRPRTRGPTTQDTPYFPFL